MSFFYHYQVLFQLVLKRLYVFLYILLSISHIFSIVIFKTIMKYYRNFFWYYVSYITNIMSSTSIFSSVMKMISDFVVFFIINTKLFFAYITDFLFMIWIAFFICQWYCCFCFQSLLFLLYVFLDLCKSFSFNFCSYNNHACFLLNQMNSVQTMNNQKVMAIYFSRWWPFSIIITSICFFK